MIALICLLEDAMLAGGIVGLSENCSSAPSACAALPA